VSTNVSEENIASIFRVEKISSARNQRASWWQAECRLTLQGTTQRYIPENGTLQIFFLITVDVLKYIL
jgi:hypothetical protein